MEELEQVPVVRSDEIFKLVSDIELEEYTPFTFNDSEYQLIWFPKEDLDKDGEAWFSSSTQIDGFDIYILEDLTDKEKRRRIFHEILEADLAKKGFSKAHEVALAEEEKLYSSP